MNLVQPAQDRRIRDIMELILQITSGNLSARRTPSDLGDEVDAIIVGINMLGEELSASFEAVRKARDELEERVKERTADLALVNMLNDAANRGVDLQDVIELLCAETKRIFACRGVTVYLLSEDEDYLVAQNLNLPRATASRIEKLIGTRIPQTRIALKAGGVYHQLLQAGRPQITNDPATIQGMMAEFTENEVLRRLIPQIYRILKIGSVMSVPLVSASGVIGLLDMSRREAFAESELKRFETISRQLSVLIGRRRAGQAEREQRALAEALRDTAADLNSTLNSDEVLDRILANVGRVVTHDAANIMLTDAERGVARVTRCQGYARVARGLESAMLALRFPVADVANLRQMAETGQPIAIPDVHAYAGWVDLAETRWLRSYVGAPIRVKGQLVGFLNLDSATPGFFSPAHGERLQAFADQAALAIANARLFEETQQHAQRLALLNEISTAINLPLELTAVLQAAVDGLARVLNVDQTGLALFDETRRHLTVVADHPAPGIPTAAGIELPVAGNLSLERILASRAPVAIADAQNDPLLAGVREVMIRRQVQAILIVPLIVRSEIIGTVGCDVIKSPRRFTPEEIALGETVANLVAARIEQARLFEAERLHRQDIEAVQQASLSLTASLELPQVLDSILSAVRNLVPLQDTHIFLYDGQRLTFAAGATPKGRLAQPITEPRSEGLTYTVARAGEPMVVEDVRQHPLPAGAPADRQGAIIGLPLTVGSTVVGVMDIYFPLPRQFAEAELRTLGLLAAHAAIAIQNARLFEATRRSAEQLAALHATLLDITSQHELSTLLQTTVERATRLLKGTSGGLYLCEPERRQVRCMVSYHTPHDYTGVVLQYGEGAAGTVALTGKPLILDDYRTWPRRAAAYEGEKPFTAIVSAPMIWQGQVIGVIHVLHNVEHWRFTESDLALLTLFAGQAAIAVENARLYDVIYRHSQELEQRIAERTAELERERSQMQTILDATGEGIIVTDPHWMIVYVNQAAERITGYTFAEMLEQNPRLLESGDVSASMLEDTRRALDRGDVWQGEVINRRKDGTRYHAALTVSPIIATDGTTMGYVSVQRDITRHKELDRLKNQLVSRIGHELRTPVSNVKLYLELLERGKPERREQYLQTLHQETDRLRNLIEGYLEMSQLDAGEVPVHLASADLNRLAADLVSGQSKLAAEHGLLLDYLPEPDLPLALADPDLLDRAMSILVENALNYTPQRGRVTCTTAVRRREDREWVTFTVQDTGPGISPEEMPRLFERFYRGEAARDYTTSGAGLGLAIGKGIIDKLDGRITVESQPGCGTAFTVWLRPAHESTSQ